MYGAVSKAGQPLFIFIYFVKNGCLTMTAQNDGTSQRCQAVCDPSLPPRKNFNASIIFYHSPCPDRYQQRPVYRMHFANHSPHRPDHCQQRPDRYH
jgi:hypothetical protein